MYNFFKTKKRKENIIIFNRFEDGYPPYVKWKDYI